jgi:hypothetical protein
LTPASAPAPREGSVRASVGMGGSDLGFSGRFGVQGEAWLNKTFGIGGTLGASDDSTLSSQRYRRMFTAEPQWVARFGGPGLQLVFAAGAGAGVGSTGSAPVSFFCPYECSESNVARPRDRLLGIASAEATLLGYAGPIALSLGGRSQATTLGGADYLVQLGAGWAIRP